MPSSNNFTSYSSKPKASRAKIEAFFGSPELLRAYETLETDKERVNFMYQLPLVQDLLHKERAGLGSGVVPVAQTKSANESKRYRELGNQAFKQGKDRKALKFYNEALIHAPTAVTAAAPKGLKVRA